jgi:hypothetical protein
MSNLTCFSHANDLPLLLNELDVHFERLLSNIFAMQELRQKHAMETDRKKRLDHAEVMQAHSQLLEMDIGVIRLNAEFITDDGVATWIVTANDSTEQHDREIQMWKLMNKMQDLEEAMVEMRIKFLDEAE